MNPVLICVGVVVLVVVLPATESNSKTGRLMNAFCSAGRPGIPGLHGRPGAPGRDGRDGREGIQGKRGPRGFQGSPGNDGKSGAPGSKGSPGKDGKLGPKGPKGDRGPRGMSSYSNWKECTWNNLNDGRDNGKIKDCIFTKKYRDTYLHVYFNGALRIHGCNSCCKRWFFTFNGQECGSPNPIDGVVFLWKGKGTQDPHRVRHIEGHCGKIHKGHVRVGFHVGNCKGYGNADAYTGWNSVSRIFIEEVPRPQK